MSSGKGSGSSRQLPEQNQYDRQAQPAERRTMPIQPLANATGAA
ncbi:hypothetical protein [Arthrobacter sp. zg-Y1110]|nr:hypothetical protein [Arthrobacter sp. zg-Y1110]UWX86827.1 hypothetical protein N2K99_18465 [Arthrobacter sp. zg-Y1110]